MSKRLFSAVAALTLAACGGENGLIPCSTETPLSITAQWNTNGQLAADVRGKVNVPLTATPVLSGVPATCAGKGEFVQDAALPSGLLLDRRTGVISGTPIKDIAFNAGSLVSIRLPGYNDTPILSKITISP
ncbi:putative Ig domain-containing protein [Noviherbaspirillum sp.]|uniref:putative Ig domain-containing protein n=1 Tax=Noviherbaspirillum sp. TaxID=1926288 RepID=UPI002B49EBAB|nr:putative Ig domain-containing protein [Noviherbaspirillum sp.]HJV80662.1 putative Ig domain-containing protein [Noviherbaspirillum sp.]